RVGIAGATVRVGRLWWPAEVVRQAVWRVLEPAGILKRDDAQEDHETRRIARILGGSLWLIAAGLILAGHAVLGWVIAVPIAVMVGLDAGLNFCALCLLLAEVDPCGLICRALG